MAKNIFVIIIVVVFSFIAGFPLLHKGLPPTHDGEYHVVRFYEFYKTFTDGDLYPRWAPDLNNGYGVPLFNYVYPLPNYVASLLHLLGFSFIDAFKIEMFAALILGAMFFYLWAKGYWGYWGGMVGAIFYTYSPYHFLDIYIRGSVGEVWVLAFFPAFLWSITKFAKDQHKIFFVSSSVFLSLIIFSHNILALMFFPFALSYVGILIYKNANKKYLILNTFYIILLSLGLSSIFWLPALFEKQYVTGLEIFDVAAHFPNLYQLLIPSWGSGFSGETVADQMSFQIGIANLIAVLLSLFLIVFRHFSLTGYRLVPVLSRDSGFLATLVTRMTFFFSRHSGKRTKRARPESVFGQDDKLKVIVFFLVWFFIIFLLMLKISFPVWQKIPFMNYFQFPWRLLSLEILVTSFLAGSIIYFWKSKVLAIFLILLVFSLGIGYIKPAYYHYRDDNYYITRANFMDGTNSPGNVFNTIFLKTDLKKQKEKLFFLKGSGKINQEIVKSTRYVFTIKAEKDSEIRVNTAYFPGWVVKLDGKKIKANITSSGLFSFFVSKGQHVVEVKLGGTLVRSLGAFGFLLSSFILIALSLTVLFATIRR